MKEADVVTTSNTGGQPDATPSPTGTRSNSHVATVIAVAMIVVTFGLALTQFISDYRSVTSEGEDRARAYALSMATDVRWYLDVARQVLKRVERQSSELQAAGNTGVVLGDVIDDLPDGVAIVLYDASGVSQQFLAVDADVVDISDRSYFQELKGGADWVVSHLIADRVTGQMTFAVGQALRRGDQFVGAAVAYAPMQVFNKTWLSVGGKDSNAYLVHEDGWLSARLPEVPTAVYDTPLPEDFVAIYFSAETGAYSAGKSPIDGVQRAIGFARVDGAPLVAAIGISTDDMLNSYWAKVLFTLAVLLPISGLLGYAALRNSRLIRRHEQVSADLATSLQRNEILFLEIHHRVKNNLQSVLSLVRLHAKSADPVAEIQPRIQGMVAVHEHIYRTDSYVDVSAPDYINSIAQQIVDASSENVTLQTNIAAVTIPNRSVMPLGQLITEAVINALKYGFPDGRPGAITILLTLDDDRNALLVIHDNGNPLPPTPGTGMGSRLMKAFAAQLNGTVDMVSSDDGVTVEVRFPLPEE
ncbi:hypothetical protein WH87_15260 [Devosia epidermidihirudinis]|uniref:histidine kinase n=2 Tax=Devosia epidermidihirudinis TaxID=1293439 RepID=A0A0F5Q5K0_9HYPH|nr:hypothetical protein WH87_15260 [Devosia epidermidihirudinis]